MQQGGDVCAFVLEGGGDGCDGSGEGGEDGETHGEHGGTVGASGDLLLGLQVKSITRCGNLDVSRASAGPF